MAADTSRRSGEYAALFRRGVGLFARQQYDHGEKAFLKVMEGCKCRAATQRHPNVLTLVITGIREENLKSTLAGLTASSTRCDNALHLDAFDSLIATYEKQERIDEAFESAAKLINLCPREPKGFLRLGKLLRLKQDPTLAYLTYKQGIEIVKRKHPNHASMKTLCEQRDKVKTLAKFDPLSRFPIELVRMIFKQLNFQSQCRSLRVSKTWKNALTSPDCKDMWQTQVYTFHNASHPGLQRLRGSFQAYAKFPLNSLLAFSKTLKVLQLREPKGVYNLEVMLGPKIPQLTNLYLGSGVYIGQDLLRALLKACSSTLEELSVFDLPSPTRGDMWYRDWPRLDKLRVARLSWTKEVHLNLHVGPFMGLTPNLQEAWLDYIAYNPHELAQSWPKLQSLFIGDNAVCELEDVELNSEPHISSDIRELHLECGRPRQQRIHIPRLDKLEKLSYFFYDSITSKELERFVRPSLESGTLRELDIRPLPLYLFFQGSTLYYGTVPDWLHSESVEYMSISSQCSSDWGSTSGSMSFTMDFSGLMERFPNLRTIDIAHHGPSDSVLAKWIKGGVRTIYHRQGSMRSDLMEWAAKEYGDAVKFVDDAPPHIPSMRPDRKVGYNYMVQAFQLNYLSLSERPSHRRRSDPNRPTTPRR